MTTSTTSTTKAKAVWSPADISSSVKQVWERFDTAVGQARQFADSLTDATLASVKANQEATSQAATTLAGLAESRSNDMKGGLAAGFELAKALLENQKQLAESLMGASGRIAS
jgi:hypothetical protein